MVLVAAMNPCPCGYFDFLVPTPMNAGRASNSASARWTKYNGTAHVSRDLFLDRIDIHVGVEPVAFEHLFGASDEEPSQVAERVKAARELQIARQGFGTTNATLSTESLFETVRKDDSLRNSGAYHVRNLSARAMGEF